MKRLSAIEGLRAYLAFWVLIGHVMGFAGYDYANLQGAAKLLRDGEWAVELFMIVSGFVIFWLLDHRHEHYRPFIIRRFFRLYPLYIVLLIGGMLSLPVFHWELTHNPDRFSAAEIVHFGGIYEASAAYSPLNLGLHLTMLHSAFPDALTGSDCMLSYLPPAWSISLEWQFYLVAPFLFWLTTNRTTWVRVAFWSGSAFLLWLAHRGATDSGFLFYRYELFLIGIMSYFIFKHAASFAPKDNTADQLAPVCIMLGGIIFLSSARYRPLLPLCLWLVFLGMAMGRDRSKPLRTIAWLFENSAAQYLGRISYGIYLSHWLVLIFVQACLFHFALPLSQETYFIALFVLTAGLTIGVSAVLHRYLEQPGIELGGKIAAYFKA